MICAHSIAVFVIGLTACNTAQAQSTDRELYLEANVVAVVPLASFSGRITPVDSDPRYALTVRIKSAVPTIADFANGPVSFAIHSPTRLFAGAPVKGKTYEFVLRRKIEDGKTKFFDLRIRKAE